MVVYFSRPEDWLPGLAGIPVAKIAAIPILLALCFSISKIRWQFPPEIILLSLLLVQLWLAVPFSPVWRGGAFKEMVNFSKVLPLVLVIYWTVRSLKRLQWILFVQAGSVAAIAIASVLHGPISGGRLEGVVSGMYGNSNDLAVSIDLSLPLCLALALTTKSYWKKLAWTLAMVTMIYAVFLTASRAGVIALIVVASVCCWQVGRRSRRPYIYLFVPVAVIVVWLHAGNSLQERFEKTNDNAEAYRSARESAQQRKELLVESLRVTVQHPLLGIGPGNFAIVSGSWHVSHNSNTQMSSEGGIPAFLLYALILWRGIANAREIRRFRKTKRDYQLFSMAIEASLGAYLVGSFFASLAYQLYPYCIVAYTTALRFIVLRDSVITGRTPKADPKTSGSLVYWDSQIPTNC